MLKMNFGRNVGITRTRIKEYIQDIAVKTPFSYTELFNIYEARPHSMPIEAALFIVEKTAFRASRSTCCLEDALALETMIYNAQK